MRRARASFVVALLGVLCMAPTVGDIGGCGTRGDRARSRSLRERAKGGGLRALQGVRALGAARCERACDPNAAPGDELPPTCRPLFHDGEVCLRALRAASCEDVRDVRRRRSRRRPRANAISARCRSRRAAAGLRATRAARGGAAARSRAAMPRGSRSLASGCATFRPMVAPPADLEDYRAFRVAAAEGTRLARAQAVPRAPSEGRVRRRGERGVRGGGACATSSARRRSREGVAPLPRRSAGRSSRGAPRSRCSSRSARACRTRSSATSRGTFATRTRSSRPRPFSGARSAKRSSRAVGVLVDEDVYGVPRHEGSAGAPHAAPRTHAARRGARVPRRREEDYFFLLPDATRARVAARHARDVGHRGRRRRRPAARIEGADMLVRWAEADQIVRLDSSCRGGPHRGPGPRDGAPRGRARAPFPAASARTPREDRELYHRACDGWEVVGPPGVEGRATRTPSSSRPRGRKQRRRPSRSKIRQPVLDDPLHPRSRPEARPAHASSVRVARRHGRHHRHLARHDAREAARARPRQAQLVHHVDARRRISRRPHARPDLLSPGRGVEAAVVDLPPLGGARLVRRLHRRAHRRRALEVLRGGAGLPDAVLHDLEVQASRVRCRSCRSAT